MIEALALVAVSGAVVVVALVVLKFLVGPWDRR